VQLCSNDADCQGSGGASCVGGTCTSPSDAGIADVGVYEGSVPAAGSGGSVPAGYPKPSPANAAQCKVTTNLVAGLCPGGGAGPVCLECLFGGSTYNDTLTPTPQAIAEAGEYLVTVVLGGASAAETSVAAESSRGLLAPVATRAGESLEYAFVVDVRAMEGQPDHAGGPGGYPGLDLFFSGPSSAPVTSIGYAVASPSSARVTVFIAGDSTVCDQTGNVYGGWGQMLPEYFAPPVAIANYANSGASSGSFGPYWNLIKARWRPGDYVLIQFGHNDKGVPDSVVQANLERFAADALAAHVTPILVSPPARVQFVGSIEADQSSLHPAAARAAAAAEGVAFIDLTALSTEWYNSLGSEQAAMQFHANHSDATHTNLAGAEKLAGLLVEAMRGQRLPLAAYLR
jgi:lysophospholipase L1-like esterase